MADDDPMAFLNAQRQKLSAISAMADVASMQNNLVAQVQQRMRSISDLETGKAAPSQRVDPEVEEWKRKIAALSAGGPPPSRADLPKPAPKAMGANVSRQRQSGIQAPRAGRGPESRTGAVQAIRRRKSEVREIKGGVGGAVGGARKREHPLLRSVEEKIEAMPLPFGVNDEVEMWRRKIAELSAVNPTASYQSPIKDTGFSPSSARGSGLDAVKRRAGRK